MSAAPAGSLPPSTGDPEVDRRFARAHKVAKALLYEGYVLYPYRPSSVRNKLRFQWGVLVPRAYVEVSGDCSEDWLMRTECILDGGPEATVWIRVQCLVLRSRTVQEVVEGSWRTVASFEAGDRLYTTWDEAAEHQVDLGPISIGRLVHEGADLPVAIAGEHAEELILDGAGEPVGRVLSDQAPIAGRVLVSVQRCEGPLTMHRIRVEIRNLTDWAGPPVHRDELMCHSLCSVHTLLAAESGDFVSHRDPPVWAREAVASCSNLGTYPILADDDDRIVLSSRIILDDHPAVAPESEGDYCDGTENDELLSLMVLALSEEEKAEARQSDAFAAAIVDRCDNMPPAVWERLHGAIRSLRPVACASPGDLEELPAPTDMAGLLDMAGLGRASHDAGSHDAGSHDAGSHDAGSHDAWPDGDFRWSEFDTVAAGRETAGRETAGRETAGRETAGRETAGRETAGAEGQSSAGGEGINAWWSPESDRSVHPMRDTVKIGGVEVGRGAQVRLRPRSSADAQDLFLAGRVAVVEGVLFDVDGGCSLALSLPEDPATELHQWYGRYLYFHPDECEPVGEPPGEPG